MKLTLALCTILFASVCFSAAGQSDSRCFELRTYYAMPEKLEALESRFRDHTCKLFEKHGLVNVGYWVPQDNPENQLIYVIASPDRDAHKKSWKEFMADPEWKKVREDSEANGKLVGKVDSVFLTASDVSPAIVPTSTPPRVFELRTYTTHTGKLEALEKRFRDHTLALFSKHGMTNVAYWKRAGDENNQLIYILAHDSKEAAEKSFESFFKDPEWIAVRTASEVDGPIVEKADSVFMEAVDFSPIR